MTSRKLTRGRGLSLLAGLACCLLLPACQQKMADQPYYRALEVSEFFEDGRSARPWVAGTVAFKQLSPNDALNTGLTAQGRVARPRGEQSAIPAGAPDDVKNFVDAFPFEVTEEHLRRGAERYTIFCVPCHGVAGDGKGKIWERGYLKPTSFQPDRQRAEKQKSDGISPNSPKYDLPIGYSRGFNRYRVQEAMDRVPVGYYFEVISKGYGAMPDYSAQISAEDRWKIIAYIRALQLSQSADLRDLPPGVQKAAKDGADAQEKSATSNGGHHP